MTHYWRVHTRLPERFGRVCRVLVSGGLNSVLVEFEDGYRVVNRPRISKRWVVEGGAECWSQALDEHISQRSSSGSHAELIEGCDH